MSARRLEKLSALILLTAALCLSRVALAQSTSGNESWTASSQQGRPDGAINPTRTNETHTENGGRVVDKTTVERLGPDGRYVPYSDTEKESVQINATTVRNIERTYGYADGHKTLIQERQVESRGLPGGEQSVTRTISNPDGNGALQVIQRELEQTNQLSPSVRVTKTTVLTPDINGGLSPAVQTEQRETRRDDGTVQSKKSTLLSDGTGGWKLSEVQESTRKQASGELGSNEERVLRPDANGTLALVEHTVTKREQDGSGARETIESYSPNVPGVAGDGSLQLVRRETTFRRSTSAGGQSTIRQIERPRPGEPSAGLQVTEQAIDIVRPSASGTADEARTILTPDADGRLRQVWVDTGETNNPSAIQVNIGTSPKPK